ncbi:MutS-related protein [Clostridium uliginosum]|uniref:MutS domain V n=1 Tax=Clostridium uliginosum TaxID=119641 RepID=A0A1I1NQI9_9CLOT|nr:DNA mismatch repair protein MutS [Clostridium uliginosum]SFC99934.1 MutS domain V [Clostridium uliginosum]
MDLKKLIKRQLKQIKDRKRNFKNIRVLFDLEKKDKYTIDNQTWDDLIMDEVFTEVDRTYSSAGESALYKMLRNPMMDEEKLNKRSNFINLFKKDLDLTIKLRCIFYNLGFDNKNRLIEMINGLLSVNKIKFYIYSLLGMVPIILIICAILFQQPYFMAILAVYVYLTIFIHNKESANVKAVGLTYLRDLINGAKSLSKIKNDELEVHMEEIKQLLDQLKAIDKATLTIKALNAFGGLLEMFAIPFFIEESTYYKISGKLIEQKDIILKLYYLVGELDALTSIAIYEDCNKENCSKPKFVTETSLKMKDGIHPLLKNPVENSIEIYNKGIVLTGTNMSGKSTFLRMVSTNIILAQTFNFVLAKEYEASFFYVVSSISPKDDIMNGKSYYLAEAESILRIIKSLENNVAVFCPIDEIFRGTNPIERISSSAEILKYINKEKSICIVATHDKELSDILKGNYDFYYFSESVDDKHGLSFDYKIKKGVSQTRNAIKLLDYVGYPKEIIENAYKRIENIEGYI